jgi:hypothetical protein
MHIIYSLLLVLNVSFASVNSDPIQAEWDLIRPLKRASAEHCQEFQRTWSKSTPADTAPVAERAALVEAWPGIPSATTRAYRFVLKHKNPPVNFDFDGFQKDLQEFSTCEFHKTASLVWGLAEALKDSKADQDARARAASVARGFLEKISHEPLDLFKSQFSVELLGRVLESRLDERINRKERAIRSLLAKFNTGARLPATEIPENAMEMWKQIHRAEAIRMEVARILYFP